MSAQAQLGQRSGAAQLDVLELVDEPRRDEIFPCVFDERVAPAVTQAVAEPQAD